MLTITTRTRPARPADIATLGRIEQSCFLTDRLTPRQFRHLLNGANGLCLVHEDQRGINGYAAVLFRDGVSCARLYSFAVAPHARGRGVGRSLLAASEQAARRRGAKRLRLEVRPDNEGAIRLYRRSGYTEIGRVARYYEDQTDAIRMEKAVTGDAARVRRAVPYYQQSLEFTCGPAALAMAMAALDRSVKPDRRTELALWRESTTIFMTSGHGGCDPYGLALAGVRRGYAVDVYLSHGGQLFLDTVRSPEKKAVMSLVQDEFRRQARRSGVGVHLRPLRPDEMLEAVGAGAIPIVLISIYWLTGEKVPHWVVVTGFDERHVFVHDPIGARAGGRAGKGYVNLPILKSAFEDVSRFGKSRLRVALLVRKKRRSA